MANDIETLLPPQLEEMSKKLVEGLASSEKHNEYLSYVSGWVHGSAKEEYRQLIHRDGIPSDPTIVKLLCELAVTRALVRWHEIRDRPPPMPSLDKL